MREVLLSSTTMPAWAMASPAAITASRLNRSIVTSRRRSMPCSGSCLISAPMPTFRSCRGVLVIGPMPLRPWRIESQMSGAVVPSAQMPPTPVMTMRGRSGRRPEAMPQPFLAISSRTATTMSLTVFEIVPDVGGVHVDLDIIFILDVEDDLGHFEGVYVQIGKQRVRLDFIRIGIRFRPDHPDDLSPRARQPCLACSPLGWGGRDSAYL